MLVHAAAHIGKQAPGSLRPARALVQCAADCTSWLLPVQDGSPLFELYHDCATCNALAAECSANGREMGRLLQLMEQLKAQVGARGRGGCRGRGRGRGRGGRVHSRINAALLACCARFALTARVAAIGSSTLAPGTPGAPRSPAYTGQNAPPSRPAAIEALQLLENTSGRHPSHRCSLPMKQSSARCPPHPCPLPMPHPPPHPHPLLPAAV